MEIPFVTTSPDFEEQYKVALGFVDVDFPFIKLRPDIKSAANELIKIIGKPVYEALMLNHVATANKDKDLSEAFQEAIACYSYMLFAPANDIAHTPNGRRMRSSEDEKTPWEWMLTSSNDNLQKRAFKAIDALIHYMDANFAAWKASEKFKITHKLFVRTLEDFSHSYVLDSRLLLIKLVPGLSRAETREIIPRITLELYNSLKEKVIYKASGETSDQTKIITEDEALLIELIKEACAYYALSWSFPRLQVNMFPEGILQAVRGDRTTIKGRMVPVTPIIDQTSKLFKDDCDIALLNIENQMKVIFPPELVNLSESESDEEKYGFSDNDNFVST